MNAFEHILVLLSFVFALAIAHILSCTASLIRAGSRVRWSWIHVSWALIALLVVIADWISFWDMRAIPQWSSGSILFTFLLAFANYLAAALVCPEVPPEGIVDLHAFHEREGGKYMGAMLACYVLAAVANLVYGQMYNLAQWSTANLMVPPTTLLVLAAVLFRGGRVQRIVPA